MRNRKLTRSPNTPFQYNLSTKTTRMPVNTFFPIPLGDDEGKYAAFESKG
jgi:hypothetical protein